MLKISAKTKLKAIAALPLAAILSGCMASAAPIEQPQIVIEPPVSSLNELKDISVEARHELRLLAKAQEAASSESLSKEQHEQRRFQATYVPPGFDKRVTFSYTGKAEEAARALAEIAGYKFKIYGKPVGHESFVRIDIEDEPLNEALKEIGLQTGSNVLIEVYPAAKLFRFVHKS